METKKIKVGAKVPLIHFLSGKETNKFVRATILDVDGDPVSASPYLLPSVASGIYMDRDTLIMPLKPLIFVTMEVFDDAGYTTPTVGYDPELIIFEAEQAQVVVDEIVGLVGEC
mgnify:CR=1 FL=1